MDFFHCEISTRYAYCIITFYYFVQGQEYTEQYYLEYQRLDNGPWVRYRNRHGQEVSYR